MRNPIETAEELHFWAAVALFGLQGLLCVTNLLLRDWWRASYWACACFLVVAVTKMR